MILWNFINLLDAEGGWFFTIILALLATVVITQILKHLFTRLSKKFRKEQYLWQHTLLQALLQPLCYSIWFVAIFYCADLVVDELFSERFPHQFTLAINIFIILMGAWFLLRWKKNLLQAIIEQQKREGTDLDTTKFQAFSKLLTAVIVIVTVLLLMEVSNQNIATLIAFGGISGLALAIASQEIISNFFSSFMIYVTRPFGVGDYIFLPSSSVEGRVEDIGWYQTRLWGPDKRPVYIPNSLFSKAYVINGSRITRRRLQEKISVRHEDLPLVPGIIKNIHEYLQTLKGIDPSENIIVNISTISPYSIDIAISFISLYTSDTDFYKFRDEMFIHIARLIEQAGAKIASQVHMQIV